MAKLTSISPQSSEEEDQSQYSDSDSDSDVTKAKAKAAQHIKPQSEEEEVEETESGSETDSEEDEEGAKPLAATKPVERTHEASNGAPISKPVALPGTKSEAKAELHIKPQSEEEEVEETESGSETDSEEEEEDDEEGAKSLAASKPVEQTHEASNGARISKPVALPETKSAAAKRPAEDTASAHHDAKKKLKTAIDEPEETTKSNLFKRVWSEKDEIAILQGMIGYASEKKGDPFSELRAFLDFIKPNLDLQDVSRSQLQDKLKRLKKKYENNIKRKGKGGKEITFSNPHELKSYDLSKLIWGNSNGSNNSASASGGEDVLRLKKSQCISFVGANAEERMLIAAQSLSLKGKKEWEELEVEEFELYLKQLEVKVAMTKVVLDNMKAKNNHY